MSRLEEFRRFREAMNERVLEEGTLELKRFFRLDGQVYEEGALPTRTKELLGLTASMVLRCDDCIAYHVLRCKEEGVSDAELQEAFSVALIVGGSIVIPHLRRAQAFLDEVNAEVEAGPGPGGGTEV